MIAVTARAPLNARLMNTSILKPTLVFFLSSMLFASLAAEETASVKSEVLARTIVSWDGETLPAYPGGQPEVTLLKITIPPHTSLPWHTHPVINAGYLLSGELTIHTSEGEAYQMKAGDSIVEVVDKLHYGENPGEVPAVILVFYAGIEGVPVTILKEDLSERQVPCCPPSVKGSSNQ